MAALPANASTIEKLKEVGRYALGVEWGDHHDSILPYRNVRAVCPCESCVGTDPAATRPPQADQLANVEVLGGRSIFFRWGDGHETILLLSELRLLCRCAHCAGEPDYPISGQ